MINRLHYRKLYDMEITKGIYQIKVPIPNNPLGYLNCYIIKGTQGWLMIDTGWNAAHSLTSLQKGLQELGLTLDDISTIVITHVHPDHFGLAGKIRQLNPAIKMLTHRWESDVIESRYVKFGELREKMSGLLERHGVPSLNLAALGSASMPVLDFVTVTFPDRILYGGEVVSTGIFDLEIIWTPGHSPGHICLYEPKNKLLFAGDHVLPKISPNISYNVQSGDNPLGDYIHALHKIEHLPVSKVLPAHEEVFLDLSGRVKELIAHHDVRKKEIAQVIAEEPHNAWEIAAKVTWDIPLPWNRFPPLHKRSAVMEVIAHLECMRWEGSVTKITEDNRVSYVARR